MSIFYQGPRAMSEWAKEELADMIIKGVDSLLEVSHLNGWGLDESNELKKQKERVLKFLNIQIVNGRHVKKA